jgi:hypothetical protein
MKKGSAIELQRWKPERADSFVVLHMTRPEDVAVELHRQEILNQGSDAKLCFYCGGRWLGRKEGDKEPVSSAVECIVCRGAGRVSSFVESLEAPPLPGRGYGGFR